MMVQPRIGLVLAAGKGTRLKSDLPKVLHPVLGKPMIQRVLESLVPLSLDQVVLVVGHQAKRVQAFVDGLKLPFSVEYVVQEPQLGTGHALMQALPLLPEGMDAEVLITCGDMPLVPSERYAGLLAYHARQSSIATLVTVALTHPTGYGRVILEEGVFQKIVEEKDATPQQKAVQWVNAGIYAVQWASFSKVLNQLSQNNAQGEFYLTDAMEILVRQHGQQAVSTTTWPDEDEILGINSRHQLAQATEILSSWTANRLMAEGVTLVQPSSMVLAPEVQVGPDTVLHPGCYLEGEVYIGQHCDIGPRTTMRGQIQVGNHCRVVESYLDRSVSIGDNSYIGPFAHLRDNAQVGEQVRIGNFVELKETRFGDRSNAAHLCYLGDAVVGDEVNMGAGSIVANYDPIRDQKHQTVIEDGVKVGCNSVLVAPVTVRTRACVAAGSVITQEVSAWDLAIARPRQTSVSQWVEKTLAEEKATL